MNAVVSVVYISLRSNWLLTIGEINDMYNISYVCVCMCEYVGDVFELYFKFSKAL